MAQKRRFLDVWIIETNTVYREVPFEVVTDWVQQGRLLADDMLRPSGTAEWFRLGENPSFAAYLPRSEPFAANDAAEALEPVQVEFAWKRRPEDEDDDVDMIPLIDVSLVLLVFFIMTASATALASNIAMPAAEYGLQSSDPQMIWVGLEKVGNETPAYSIGVGDKPPDDKDKGLATEKDVLARLDALIAERGGRPVKVQVKADEDLPSGFVRRIQLELERRGAVIVEKYEGVNEKK